MSVVIAKNQTASALSMSQIPIPDNEIPASGQATLSDYATLAEIQEDSELAAHITAGDCVLNIDGTDYSSIESSVWMQPMTTATVAEVDAGVLATKAISPAALAASALAANVATNAGKVSADGSVTTHSDVASAGSGEIITTAERTKLSGIEAGADVTDAINVAGAGAVMASLVDVKGDIFVATADDTIARLPVGSDGDTLVADSSEPTGVRWDSGGPGPTTARMACCPFGAKSDSKGKFLIANGKSSDGDDSSKPKTRHALPTNGNLVGLVYQTKEATSSTQMKIHVAGAVEATVTLASINADYGGVESLSVSVTAGQMVEIEYDDDDKPGECTMYLLLEYAL